MKENKHKTNNNPKCNYNPEAALDALEGMTKQEWEIFKREIDFMFQQLESFNTLEADNISFIKTKRISWNN